MGTDEEETLAMAGYSSEADAVEVCRAHPTRTRWQRGGMKSDGTDLFCRAAFRENCRQHDMIIVVGKAEKTCLDRLKYAGDIAIEPSAEVFCSDRYPRLLKETHTVGDIGHIVDPAQRVECNLGGDRNAERC